MVEELSDAVRCLFDGAGVFLAQQRLELRESLFDRVQVRAVWRKEDQFGPSGFDRAPDRGRLVAAEVVHHHHVAAAQGWQEELDHPGQEVDGIDRAIKHARSDDPVTPQPRDKRQCFPMTMRHFGDQSLANGAASMSAGHVCLGPVDLLRSSTVDKDQALGIDFALQSFPLLAAPGDVMAVLLARAQTFF